MTDLYLVAGDLETLYERVGYVVEDLGPVVVEEVGSYIHGGMPGGQGADLGVQAADAIDKRVGGVVSGLSDFCVNLADMIAQFAATEDANTVAFQNIAHSSGVN